MLQRPLQRTPILAGVDTTAKREEILSYFHVTFDCYESLFETLANDEAYFHKPISLRHPLIFTTATPLLFYQ